MGTISGKPLHYRNVPFHRVVPSFMIQGGDLEFGNGQGGESIYGTQGLPDEPAGLKLKHTAWRVAMAHRGPNTATSQFYIT
jgi:peptidylprolyl isomerase